MTVMKPVSYQTSKTNNDFFYVHFCKNVTFLEIVQKRKQNNFSPNASGLKSVRT